MASEPFHAALRPNPRFVEVVGHQLNQLEAIRGQVEIAKQLIEEHKVNDHLRKSVKQYDDAVTAMQQAVKADKTKIFAAELARPMLSQKKVVEDLFKKARIGLPPPPPVEPEPSREAVKEALLAEYDQLNEFWEKAEKLLADCHAPVECTALIKKYPDDYRDPQTEYYEELGWAKIGGRWRICFGISSAHDPETDWTPIQDCSADTRVAAVEVFDDLRKALDEASKAYIDKVRKANAKFASLLK